MDVKSWFQKVLRVGWTSNLLLFGWSATLVERRRHLQLWRRQAEVDLLSYLEVPEFLFGCLGKKVVGCDDSILVDGGCRLWDFTTFHIYLLSSCHEVEHISLQKVFYSLFFLLMLLGKGISESIQQSLTFPLGIPLIRTCQLSGFLENCSIPCST